MQKVVYNTSCHISVGTWRSLVARLLWEQDVAGSNPVVPTIETFGERGGFSKRVAAFTFLGRKDRLEQIPNDLSSAKGR